MKIKILKEKLSKSAANNMIRIKKHNNAELNKEPIIIGVTGSRGKSSVCYMLHNYLKNIGYKSVLYSSIEIDSDLSYVKKHCAVDNPLKTKKNLLSAVDQCIKSNADFLILEVNERAIDLGLIDDVEFDIKVLTNIIEKQNEVFYPNYVDIKKKFLKNSSKGEKQILVVKDNHCCDLIKELERENLRLITSPFLKQRFNFETNNLDYIIGSVQGQFDSLSGVNFSIQQNNILETVKSKLLFPYSIFNIACVFSILKELNLYKPLEFQNLINSIIIPGRDEVVKFKNRYIIISVNLVPQLEYLRKYIYNNKLLVVTGVTGLGFSGWMNEFSNELLQKDKNLSMSFAYNYIKNYADEVYITISDIGSSNKDELLNEQYKLVNNEIACYIVDNRKAAIKTAILNSKPNDVIFISGRGNREILCDSINHISLLKDIDILNEIIYEIEGGELS